MRELKEHTGVMIALQVPEDIRGTVIAMQELLPEGSDLIPADELHLTLLYLGDSMDLAEMKTGVYVGALSPLEWQSGIRATLAGLARLNGAEGNSNALVLLVDSPQLPQFRQRLLGEVIGRGVPNNQKHGFIPHITLGYISADADTPQIDVPPLEMVFDSTIIAWGDEQLVLPLSPPPSLSVIKQADGSYRWLGITSTAYRDRDGEFVSMQALAEDCERADQDGRYGPLRWWHVGDPDPAAWLAEKGEPWGPGLDLGTCDFNMTLGPFLIESGLFHSPIIGEAVAGQAADLEFSIGFHYPTAEKVEKTYQSIRRFERSLLPRGKASNLLTSLVVEGKMASKKSVMDKVKELVALAGEDAVDELLDQAVAGKTHAGLARLSLKATMTVTEEDDEEEEDEEEEGGDKKPKKRAAKKEAEAESLKAALESALAPVVKGLADTGERLKALESLPASLAALDARLKELEGGTPNALKVYRASQAPDTVLDAALMESLKGAPAADNTNSVAARLLGFNVSDVPQ